VGKGVIHIYNVTRRGGGVHDIVTMRDVGEGVAEGVKSFVTSRTSHLRQGLAKESWMIALVHRPNTGLHGTLRMSQLIRRRMM